MRWQSLTHSRNYKVRQTAANYNVPQTANNEVPQKAANLFGNSWNDVASAHETNRQVEDGHGAESHRSFKVRPGPKQFLQGIHKHFFYGAVCCDQTEWNWSQAIFLKNISVVLSCYGVILWRQQRGLSPPRHSLVILLALGCTYKLTGHGRFAPYYLCSRVQSTVTLFQ